MTTRIAFGDFETRSTADLRKCGAHLYAQHPLTDVLCLSYAFDDEPVQIWRRGDPAPEALLDHIADGGEFIGHNVGGFEVPVWRHVMRDRHGWPELRIEQCTDTMAMAYAMALPGSLEAAAAAVGITEQKDMAGSRIMLQLARPRKVNPDGSIVWWTREAHPEKFERLYAYCQQDTEVERALYRRLRPLSEHERAVWLLDYQINQRGLHIDRAAIEAAIRLVDAEKLRLDGEMRAITGNTVSACSNVNQLTDWLRWQGVETGGVAKADVTALLEGDLPDNARRALALRQEAARSSTAKLTAMLERAGDDDRIRGTKQYHGASTGRWAGRGAQPDNYPRGKLKPREVDAAIRLIQRGERDAVDLLYGAPMDVVSSCLRGFITAAPGHDLIACDYSNVEGRVLAWLAGEEWKLQAFRDFDTIVGLDSRGEPIRKGPDLYILTYAKSFNLDHREITKKDPRRQVGKTEELAFGFQGALGAWRTMERAYPGTPYLDDGAVLDVNRRWREAHPATVRYWYALDAAVIEAVRTGRQTMAGAEGRQVKFRVNGSFLWCQLPSKRLLCYPYPRLVRSRFDRDALRYKGVNGVTRKWEDTDTYGGKLAENITQATARDLLADGLLRLSQHGYRIVMHVHDEPVAEVPTDFGSLEEMARLMSQLPAWAKGLPVTAEGWRGPRYRK